MLNAIPDPNQKWQLKSTSKRPLFEPEKFGGKPKEDIHDFLNSYDKAARVNNWTETEKVDLLENYLTGTAQKYIKALDESIGAALTFETAKEELLRVFAPVQRATKLEIELTNMKQGINQTVEDYLISVERLAKKCDPKMPEEKIVTHSLKGLRRDIAKDLLLKEIKTLAQLREGVKVLEVRDYLLNQSLTDQTIPNTDNSQIDKDNKPTEKSETLVNMLKTLQTDIKELCHSVIQTKDSVNYVSHHPNRQQGFVDRDQNNQYRRTHSPSPNPDYYRNDHNYTNRQRSPSPYRNDPYPSHRPRSRDRVDRNNNRNSSNQYYIDNSQAQDRYNNNYNRNDNYYNRSSRSRERDQNHNYSYNNNRTNFISPNRQQRYHPQNYSNNNYSNLYNNRPSSPYNSDYQNQSSRNYDINRNAQQPFPNRSPSRNPNFKNTSRDRTPPQPNRSNTYNNTSNRPNSRSQSPIQCNQANFFPNHSPN
nr:PREDICTED: putative uncharacterized protein DDB_G0282499 [Bemisia tabaci]